MSNKIVVDTEGLKRIVRERGEVTLLDEMVQNALDTPRRTRVTVDIRSSAVNRVRIIVTDDDPDGFDDLSDAYTLFGESVKRDDPSKRGFMNVGDKLCLAYAVAGRITTTSGSVVIDGDTRKNGRTKRPVGTFVDLTFPMSKTTMAKLIERAHQYLIPEGIEFFVNGALVPGSMPACSTSAKLKLYVGVDEDGMSVMRERERTTQLDLYEPDLRGAWIYVLGIPVQPAEELPFSVDVRGRLKSDLKRDQIPPAAFHRIKVAVANMVADELTQDDFSTWARPQVVEDASDAVVRRVITETYGADAMVANPSDPTANIRAVEEGRTLIPPKAVTPATWVRVREIRGADASFVPSTSSEYGDTIGGVLDGAIPSAIWTARAVEVVDYAYRLFVHLFPGATLHVTITGGSRAPDCMAAMSRHGSAGELIINQGTIGWDWFEDRHEVLDTLIHEFAHYAADGHGHSIRWGESCADIGARIALWGQLP